MATQNSYQLEPLKATQLSARPSAMQAPFFSLSSAAARPTSLFVPPNPMASPALSTSPPVTPAFVSQQPPQMNPALTDPSRTSSSPAFPPSRNSGAFMPAAPQGPANPAAAVDFSSQSFEQPSGAASPPPSVGGMMGQDDTQVMTKLQQLMNQMGNFMKSVDARLNTLEKMTQQLISNQTEQAKTIELRFQETAQLIQQKSSVIIPSSQQSPHIPNIPASLQQQQQQQQQQASNNPYGFPTSNPSSASNNNNNADRDYEIARQLQEQFDRESSQVAQATQQQQQHQQQHHQPQLQQFQNPYAPPQSPYAAYGQGNLTSLQLQQMQAQQPPAPEKKALDPKQPTQCPICGVTMGLQDMEAHVNQHFDEAEGIVAETLDKKNAKKNTSFWTKLWGGDEQEMPAQPMPPTQAAPPRPMVSPQMVMYPAAGMPGQPVSNIYPSFAYPGQPLQPNYNPYNK